jgi:hypothetical protein
MTSSNTEDPAHVPEKPTSTDLPIPPEFRLEVYKDLPQLVYRKLPYSREVELNAYWPCFTLSSGLASTNSRLYSKLQAILPDIRPQDEPDIICELPPFFPIYEVFEIID